MKHSLYIISAIVFFLVGCNGKIPGYVYEDLCQSGYFDKYHNTFIVNNASTNSIAAISWLGAKTACSYQQFNGVWTNTNTGSHNSGEYVAYDVYKYFAPNGGSLHFDASPLMAIKLSPSNTVYYSGYPVGKQAELGTWLNANQPALITALGAGTPLPTQATMDRYGLYYLLDNAGKASLGMPTRTPDRVDAYTSLDPSGKAYDPNGFIITFTVNGPNPADVAITFSATPR